MANVKDLISNLKDNKNQILEIIEELEGLSDSGDAEASLELASLFRKGLGFVPNDDRYLEFLKKAIDQELNSEYIVAEQAHNFYSLNYEWTSIYNMFPELFSGMGIDIAYATLDYCKAVLPFCNREKLSEILELLKKANSIFLVSGAGIEHLIGEVQGKIDGCNEPVPEDSTSVEQPLSGQYCKLLEDKCGDAVFSKMSETEKIEIATASMLFDCLKKADIDTISIADYSSVIIPLANAMEYVMFKRLYSAYLPYLTDTLPPEEYAKIINEAGTDPVQKTEVLRKNKESFVYVSTQKVLFTFSILRYTFGYKDPKLGYKLDKPAIRFCIERLINKDRFSNLYNKNAEDSSVAEWLTGLIDSVEEVARIRNRAAHGLIIMKREDYVAIRDILTDAEKVLLNFIYVTN